MGGAHNPDTQMQEEDRRELGGVAFSNGAKVSEKHPDWVGKCTIKGQTYSVALWNKNSQRTGVPFVSMSFREENPEQETVEALSSEINNLVVKIGKKLEIESPDTDRSHLNAVGDHIWKFRLVLDGIKI